MSRSGLPLLHHPPLLLPPIPRPPNSNHPHLPLYLRHHLHLHLPPPSRLPRHLPLRWRMAERHYPGPR